MSIFTDLEARAKGELDHLVELVKADAATAEDHIRNAFHLGTLHSALSQLEASVEAKRVALVAEYHKLVG